MSTKKYPFQNIYTDLISEYLGVTIPVALRVQKFIDENYNLDWSEADEDEMEFYFELAFENLTETIQL